MHYLNRKINIPVYFHFLKTYCIYYEANITSTSKINNINLSWFSYFSSITKITIKCFSFPYYIRKQSIKLYGIHHEIKYNPMLYNTQSSTVCHPPHSGALKDWISVKMTSLSIIVIKRS